MLLKLKLRKDKISPMTLEEAIAKKAMRMKSTNDFNKDKGFLYKEKCNS